MRCVNGLVAKGEHLSSTYVRFTLLQFCWQLLCLKECKRGDIGWHLPLGSERV